VATLAAELKSLRATVNSLRAQRNSLASDASLSKEQKSEKGKQIRKEIQELEARLTELDEIVMDEALHLPNLTHPDVPIGPESQANVVKTVGVPKTTAFPLKDHVAIGEALDAFDFARASAVTGSKFAFMRNISNSTLSLL
jgi:seryl-tRNA synthetase